MEQTTKVSPACCQVQHKEHHHSSELRSIIIKIVAATILLIAAVLIEHTFSLALWQLLLIYLVPYLIVGFDTLREAVEHIVHGDVFNEDFLMSIATLGALSIGFLPGAEHQLPEAVFVMLFFQVGEFFETLAEGNSRKSISQLMDIRPDTAHVERGGDVITMAPADIHVGETILIKPGERVPLDGVVIEGESSLDTVALTGESVPRSVHVHNTILSGCINLTGLLRVRVTKEAGESTATKILELVENASDNKSKSENFVTRFARIYTPVVVIAAIALAFVPPFFTSGTYLDALPTWLYRALTFLVVSCPCALVISVPLSFFGGIGGASKQGILIKGANYLEALSKLDIAVFDKTGTLTQGVFAVTVVHPHDISEAELLHIAAHVERFSNHPIAISLRNAYPNEAFDDCDVEDVEEITGQGIKAKVNGKCVYVGNSKLMTAIGADWHPCTQEAQGTVIHVAIDGSYVGHIVISDRIKDDSAMAIQQLKRAKVRKTVMLTGDQHSVGEYVAQQLGIDQCYTELTPLNKVEILEQVLQEKMSGKTLAFVGDGINDAPVLARADIGIAMGGLGSDAAIEAADIVLMDDKPSKIATAIRIAQRTIRIANQNVYFSIGIKVLVLFLASIGIANMWMAVFADVGVTVLAVLNAMRALRTR